MSSPHKDNGERIVDLEAYRIDAIFRALDNDLAVLFCGTDWAPYVRPRWFPHDPRVWGRLRYREQEGVEVTFIGDPSKDFEMGPDGCRGFVRRRAVVIDENRRILRRG